MARYIETAFAGLKEILGEVHPESYICVQEVRAFSWAMAGELKRIATLPPSSKRRPLRDEKPAIERFAGTDIDETGGYYESDPFIRT